MSSATLYLSGLLVAGGLILGAFTLHGYFDPQWAQKQARVATVNERPGGAAKAINAFQHRRSRFVSSRAEDAKPGTRRQAATIPSVPAAKAALNGRDAREPAKKRLARKRAAEQPKRPPPPQQQQAFFQWPLWKLFSN